VNVVVCRFLLHLFEIILSSFVGLLLDFALFSYFKVLGL